MSDKHTSEMRIDQRWRKRLRWSYNRVKCFFTGHWWIISEEFILPKATCVRCGQERIAHTIGGREFPEASEEK